MRLSFQFEDFFRNGSCGDEARSDIKLPTFLVEEGVIGDLKIKNMKEILLNDQDARIEIKLEGYMWAELDTCVETHQELRITMNKKVLSMTQALSVQRHARNASNNERHYPFNFNVQSWLQQDQQNSPHHRDMASRNNFASIPPSLEHEVSNTAQGVPKPRAGARVTYKLSARLLQGHKLVDRISQPILLLLAQTPSPPMCVTDFTGEYRSAQRCALRGPLFQKSGELSMFVNEPQQLNVKAGCMTAMVEVPVKLRWERSKQDVVAYPKICIEADVRWQFRLSTFVSILEQKGPATMKEALSSPATAVVKSALEPRELSMAWRKWKLISNGKTSEILESNQSIWLTMPRSEILTPTFWGSFLSRRYSLWLQLKVTKPGSAKMEVEVPIQVGIGSTGLGPYEEISIFDSRNCEDPSFHAEGDELLPQYVR